MLTVKTLIAKNTIPIFAIPLQKLIPDENGPETLIK
jgi:hypothetical protein